MIPIGIVDTLTTPLGMLWARVVRWLRRPRLRKNGALESVIVTRDGVVVPTLRNVPVRSTKADAKRVALNWARTHWDDPHMTWGQARKRLRKLEAETRGATKLLLDGKNAAAAVEAALE